MINFLLVLLVVSVTEFGSGQITLEPEPLQPNPYNFGYTIQDENGNKQHRVEEGNEEGVKRGNVLLLSM